MRIFPELFRNSLTFSSNSMLHGKLDLILGVATAKNSLPFMMKLLLNWLLKVLL